MFGSGPGSAALSSKETGNSFVKKGNYEKAIEAYTSALISSESFRVQVLTNRALCHLKTKRWQSCCEDCTVALAFDCTCIKAWFRRGQARLMMGGVDALKSARSDFREVLKIDPKNRTAAKALRKVDLKLREGKNADGDDDDDVAGVAFIGMDSLIYDARISHFFVGQDKYKRNRERCDKFADFCELLDSGAKLLGYRTVVTMESSVKQFLLPLQSFYNSGGRVVILIDTGVFKFAENTLSPTFNVNWKLTSYESNQYILTETGAEYTGGVVGERTCYEKGHDLIAPEEECLLLPEHDFEETFGYAIDDTTNECFDQEDVDYWLETPRPVKTPIAFHTDRSHGGQLLYVGICAFYRNKKLSRLVESVILHES